MEGEGPIALVTGCSSGIGRALALEFAAQGVTVLATARHVGALDDLTSQYENIEAFPLELGDKESIERLRDMVFKRTGGRLDYLVNNAGVHYAATAMDMDVEEAVKIFNVNVFAVMRLCQLFIPFLRKSSRGTIVQIGSVTREVPVVWQAAYNASKAALCQYTKTLRLELKPFGISVIEIVTGFVRSNILHHGLYAPEDSLYLPIKSTIELLKYGGNANGMAADAYARSVVSKVLHGYAGPEIWEGHLAWRLRFLYSIFPLWFLDWLCFRQYKLYVLGKPR
ncbi:NAD(P)-binding protein [Coniochaeta sp. PMI_546]|nr:NAD(P)-binding protein [Coniochaeta sp. PMI_546]